MANLQEIKTRIGNVNSTKKITRAMYLISASKSQKAKSQLQGSLPYFQQITAIMAEILSGSEGVKTPFIVPDPNENIPPRDLYVVLGGDKGMAGGYNHNVMAQAEQLIDKQNDDVLVAGFLTRLHMKQQGYRVSDEMRCPVMNPSVYRAREVAELVVEKYRSREYRTISILYTEMVSSVKQEPTVLQLLPLDTDAICVHAPRPEFLDEIEYLSSARDVFDHLVPHYLKGIIYSVFVEAFASEQHARMMAMDGATKSANETIDKLTVSYNRARQSKITQELTEIIGGIPEE